MQTARELLLDVYQDAYGPKITLANLGELAGDLSRIVGRSRPWTGKFLHSLIKQYAGFSTNSQLIKALNILAAQRDGLNEVQARAQEINGVLAVNELPPGTVILGVARRCAAPGCPVRFVPTHPRQKYHSKGCAALARRQKQAAEMAYQDRIDDKQGRVSLFQTG
ncbi:MAG TPA: hypothetical protein VEC96_17135 [Anaerolineae bacterium]|nr:hypothetical protein [Anaerolineae bacterium]HXW00049.1 hypothetical protein [Anaerolineae bacterium]